MSITIRRLKPISLLSAASWATSPAFASLDFKETQLEYYERNGADEAVKRFVALESKSFGSKAEQLLKSILGLGPRTSSQNDATLNGKKIEIKSARYWTSSTDCKWQHLEIGHDYDVVLFALLDFTGWKLWAAHKEDLIGPMREALVLTNQGEQGWWLIKSAAEPYLTEITDRDSLVAFCV